MEQRTIAAHRAYIDALVAWENAIRSSSSPDVSSPDAHQRRCLTARAEKERCRVAFRDLCDELGYIPFGHGVGLPTEAPAESEAHTRH
nr:hypothetical protein [Ancylobacter dichloromethanicus]